ncbi:MAG: hypothetical protein EOO43_17450 [Flavobacterium sp.]|nr:MAG: hypothetical protein EOO43_17450 [Flavobacterium sp.]
MKPFAMICAVILGLVISSCNTENRKDNMNDTTAGADTNFMNLDTGSNMTDTAGMDTMNNNNGMGATDGTSTNNQGSTNQ